MGFSDHLTDLRSTMIRVLLIWGVSFMICYSYGDLLADYLIKPLKTALNGEGEIVFLEIFDKVLAKFQLGFWAGIILSSPLWFYEIWKFIKPALYEKELKIIRPFLFVGFLLFVLGVLFGYFIAFPFAFDLILNFEISSIEEIKASINLRSYLVMFSKILLFLGLIFQLPNVMLILGFMGVVTKQSLATMRPYVYVAFSVVSAMMTPPDPTTLLLLWVPLVALFEVGLLGVKLIVHPYLHRKHMGES